MRKRDDGQTVVAVDRFGYRRSLDSRGLGFRSVLFMRMWMVNPRRMCRQHLLGEHLECHMFVGAINAGTRLSGFARNGLLETSSLRQRHEALAKEMRRRGYRHSSPLPGFQRNLFWWFGGNFGKVDRKRSQQELFKRCKMCREVKHNAR